jgi:hypothetical protein
MDDIYISQDDEKQLFDNIFYCFSVNMLHGSNINTIYHNPFIGNHLILNIQTNNKKLIILLNELFLVPGVINDIIYKYCADIWFVQVFNTCVGLNGLNITSIVFTFLVNEDISFKKYPISFCYNIMLKYNSTRIVRLDNKYGNMPFFSLAQPQDQIKQNDGFQILFGNTYGLSMINLKYIFEYFMNNITDEKISIEILNEMHEFSIKKTDYYTYDLESYNKEYKLTLRVYNKNILTKVAHIMLFLDKLLTNIYSKWKKYGY